MSGENVRTVSRCLNERAHVSLRMQVDPGAQVAAGGAASPRLKSNLDGRPWQACSRKQLTNRRGGGRREKKV